MTMERGKSWPQILAILVGSLSALSGGVLYSWSSPFIVQITQDKENYDITVEQASYFTMIPPIVMMFSCSIASRFSDSIGRKRTLLMIAIPQICSWILCIIAKDVYVFYAARVCSGIGDGIMFSALPMYIGEVCTPQVRAFWGTSINLMVAVGQLLINIVGSYCTVRETSYIFIILPIIFLLTFSTMPESPYFYIMKGREDRARASLQKLRRKKDIEDDFIRLKSDVQRQISESGTWTDVITIPSNRRALLAGSFLRISQQCTGFSAIGVYNKFIFENSSGDVSSSVSSIISTAVSCFMALIGGLVIARVGRKLSYIISLTLSACVLLLLAAFSYLQDNIELDMSSFEWFPLVALLSYLVFAGMGISIIPTTMLGELFSASIKAKGLSFLLFVFGCSQFLGNYLFMLLFSNFGIYCPFLLYGICCIVSAVLSIYLVPETKGKTLEDIQQSMKNAESVIVST